MQLEYSLNEAMNGLVVKGATIDGEVVEDEYRNLNR